jgi:hypothetical protein
MEFFETVAGRRFFEKQLPDLIRAMEKIAAELQRSNDLKEKDGAEPTVNFQCYAYTIKKQKKEL